MAKPYDRALDRAKEHVWGLCRSFQGFLHGHFFPRLKPWAVIVAAPDGARLVLLTHFASPRGEKSGLGLKRRGFEYSVSRFHHEGDLFHLVDPHDVCAGGNRQRNSG